jgi:hypothetical protein
LKPPTDFPDNGRGTGRLRYLLKSGAGSHVDRLMREGRSLLSGGRGREASHRFSRVLLDDPGHAGARRAEKEARALLGEEERLAGLRLHEAQGALGAHDFEEARRLADEALHHGADPDVVQPLFDRLDERSGRLGDLHPPLASAFLPQTLASRTFGKSRIALVAAWTVAIALFLGVVATSWDEILGRLAQAPWPTSEPAPPVTSLPIESPGEAALVEARRLLLAGQAQRALRALDRIPAQDPNYPYARRLRAEAESALASPGASR